MFLTNNVHITAKTAIEIMHFIDMSRLIPAKFLTCTMHSLLLKTNHLSRIRCKNAGTFTQKNYTRAIHFADMKRGCKDFPQCFSEFGPVSFEPKSGEKRVGYELKYDGIYGRTYSRMKGKRERESLTSLLCCSFLCAG